MNIQDFAKLIRQTPITIRRRIQKGLIPSKLIPKTHGGYKHEIDEDYIKNLLKERK